MMYGMSVFPFIYFLEIFRNQSKVRREISIKGEIFVKANNYQMMFVLLKFNYLS